MNRLKNYEFEEGYTHEIKVEYPVSNTFMPLSALSTMSLPSVQTVIEFTNWIPKIMVKFSYLRLYNGTDNVSRRLLQNGLKLRPTRYQDIHTSRHWTYSNQDTCTYWFLSDNESAEKGDFEVVYSSRTVRSIRDHDWCVWIYEAGVYWLSYTT